jgi:hypothetical protein
MLRGQMLDTRGNANAWIVWLGVGVVIVVLQTTLLALPGFKGLLYDLLIPLTVFLSLDLSRKKAAFLVVSIGFFMDLFSGGPFGFYLSVYFWVLVLSRGASRTFDVKGAVFRSIFVALCVLGQHAAFLVFSAGLERGASALAQRMSMLIWQGFLALVTAPAVLSTLEKAHSRLTSQEGNGEAGFSSLR